MLNYSSLIKKVQGAFQGCIKTCCSGNLNESNHLTSQAEAARHAVISVIDSPSGKAANEPERSMQRIMTVIRWTL